MPVGGPDEDGLSHAETLPRSIATRIVLLGTDTVALEAKQVISRTPSLLGGRLSLRPMGGIASELWAAVQFD